MNNRDGFSILVKTGSNVIYHWLNILPRCADGGTIKRVLPAIYGWKIKLKYLDVAFIYAIRFRCICAVSSNLLHVMESEGYKQKASMFNVNDEINNQIKKYVKNSLQWKMIKRL